MNAHFRMTGQKIADCFGFMRAQVVANDVNGLLWSLACDQIFQKGNELRTGVAVAGLADNFPALGIKSRKERQRSMAVVSKAVPFGAIRAKATKPGPSDPALGWHSFRRRRTLRR